jgi:hypothetical protein
MVSPFENANPPARHRRGKYSRSKQLSAISFQLSAIGHLLLPAAYQLPGNSKFEKYWQHGRAVVSLKADR